MNAILTVPRNLMKNVISGVFNKTNTSMPLQSFTKATKQAYKAECVVNFNFIKHTAYNNMSRSDNNVELLITLVKNNQQCLQGFRVEIVNHFIIISTLWIHSEDTGWIFNLRKLLGPTSGTPMQKENVFPRFSARYALILSVRDGMVRGIDALDWGNKTWCGCKTGLTLFPHP